MVLKTELADKIDTEITEKIKENISDQNKMSRTFNNMSSLHDKEFYKKSFGSKSFSFIFKKKFKKKLQKSLKLRISIMITLTLRSSRKLITLMEFMFMMSIYKAITEMEMARDRLPTK